MQLEKKVVVSNYDIRVSQDPTEIISLTVSESVSFGMWTGHSSFSGLRNKP